MDLVHLKMIMQVKKDLLVLEKSVLEFLKKIILTISQQEFLQKALNYLKIQSLPQQKKAMAHKRQNIQQAANLSLLGIISLFWTQK